MAHYLRHLTVVALSSIALLTTANARPSPGSDRQLSFTVFSAEPISNLSYIPQPDAAPVALAFYPTARSPRYAYRGSSRLQFLDAKMGEVRAEVTLPAGIRNALLVLFPNEAGASGASHYRIQVLDDDPSRAEPGTLLILNYSGLELAGTIDRQHVSLQPGTNGPIRVDGAATINLRTPFNGRSYQSYAETIPLGRSAWGLLILLPPYRPGALEVQSRVLLDDPPSMPALTFERR